ncbi:3'-5' exonuclease [Enterobacter hormaechei]|uniref:3'-5' exonuclease n=1 Tax=Enterobacter TaxID=547 RepID=UPI0006437518|nr:MULTISPECIES: 3'-5' exonuclease [Enterobacter]KLR15353.1 exonuclease [Enterobacter hormaechei subsp. hormaechei]MBU8926389.1 3'-5' exonuclease [Enterobacter hormaechei]MBU8930851.1 3'-5' exonuclease [Enterobacter hormaechei]MBU8938069.1 3'-5' exonuclease [Enterobacter hormaechei]MBU8947527.1 3'-5' exonuclease [Enterobacter hormaechei]
MKNKEKYISVDVETSGPVPGEYSLLSIGACVVNGSESTFYRELKPDSPRHDAQALAVAGLDLSVLAREGHTPAEAMRHFKSWVESVAEPDKKVIFVGFNAPFDWSFINYYFHKYTNENPFGFSALDIKAYYMGLTGCHWEETKSSLITRKLDLKLQPSHNALDDARFQAELFAAILKN